MILWVINLIIISIRRQIFFQTHNMPVVVVGTVRDSKKWPRSNGSISDSGIYVVIEEKNNRCLDNTQVAKPLMQREYRCLMISD